MLPDENQEKDLHPLLNLNCKISSAQNIAGFFFVFFFNSVYTVCIGEVNFPWRYKWITGERKRKQTQHILNMQMETITIQPTFYKRETCNKEAEIRHC